MSGISQGRFCTVGGLGFQEQVVICEGMLIFRYKVMNNSTNVVKTVQLIVVQGRHPPRILPLIHY